MEGMKCNVEIEELCDDSVEPAGYNFSVTTMLDTEQGSQAKDILGYDNELEGFCSEIAKVMKEFPQRSV